MIAKLVLEIDQRQIKPYLIKNEKIRILVNGEPDTTLLLDEETKLHIFKNRTHIIWVYCSNGKRDSMTIFERV
jgi:hypothetical protein